MKKNDPRGYGWVITQAILLFFTALSGPLARSESPPISRNISVILGLLGIFVAIAGIKGLGKNLTPLPTPSAHAQLVTSGIYSRVRHPLYLSLILLAASWTLFWMSSLTAVFTTVLLGFFRAKASREERALTGRFAEYSEYAQSVPGFVPRIFNPAAFPPRNTL